MRHMDSQARITAIAGPARAIYILHVIARLQRDAARGATWTRLADRLVAEDTGLSHDQVQRARRWWAALGVIHTICRGIPPTIEYDIAATLSAWEAWLQANHITPNYAPARNQLRASASSFTRQRVKLYAPARPLDHDHDDDDDRAHIQKQIAQAETAARELGIDPARIQEECNAYHPKYPDRYYLKALRQRIAQAQAPLPAAPPAPQRARARARNSFIRRQVQYTEEQRKAIEERARQELLSEAYSEENTAGRSP
jgi:hypothetical protein